jgi:UPF0716 protein FxsA
MQMNPLRLLFFIFIAVPVLEIYLLVQVGSIFGALTTALLVVATAIIGAWLLRLQGFSTWQRVQQSMNQGELPAIEMIEGLILLVSGALLLTPGFFTDAIGFFCLIPPFRTRLALLVFKNSAFRSSVPMHGSGDPKDQSEPGVIEGEFKREE